MVLFPSKLVQVLKDVGGKNGAGRKNRIHSGSHTECLWKTPSKTVLKYVCEPHLQYKPPTLRISRRESEFAIFIPNRTIIKDV